MAKTVTDIDKKIYIQKRNCGIGTLSPLQSKTCGCRLCNLKKRKIFCA